MPSVSPLCPCLCPSRSRQPTPSPSLRAADPGPRTRQIGAPMALGVGSHNSFPQGAMRVWYASILVHQSPTTSDSSNSWLCWSGGWTVGGRRTADDMRWKTKSFLAWCARWGTACMAVAPVPMMPMCLSLSIFKLKSLGVPFVTIRSSPILRCGTCAPPPPSENSSPVVLGICGFENTPNAIMKYRAFILMFRVAWPGLAWPSLLRQNHYPFLVVLAPYWGS